MAVIWPFFIGFFRPNFSLHTIDLYFLNFFGFSKLVSFNYMYLILAASILFFSNKKFKKEIIFIFTSFIFFFILYLPIFSESRMALTPGIFIIILSAYSLDKLSSFLKNYVPMLKIIIIFIFSIIFILSLSSAYQNIFIHGSSKLLETESVIQIKNQIPENCYAISEFPSVLTSISNVKGLVTMDVVKNPKIVENLINKKECVYYFYDGYCIEDTISRPLGSKLRCERMLEIFEYEQEKRFERRDVTYSLLRIKGISKTLN